MSADNVSLDAAVSKNLQKNYASSPLEYAKKRTEELLEESTDHKKLTDDNNNYASIFKMLRNGYYGKSKLRSLINLQAGSYSSTDGTNGILYAEQKSYIDKIRKMATEQEKALKDFDSRTRFEDINLDSANGVVVSKKDYDFAQAIMNQLQQNGDNNISFDEILAEIQNGKFNT